MWAYRWTDGQLPLCWLVFLCHVTVGVWNRQWSGWSEPVSGQHGEARPSAPGYFLLIHPLLSGLQLPECDGVADRQREALFHHGALWEGQPPHPLLRVHGAGSGLLPALLPDLQDTTVTPHMCCSGRDFCFVKPRGSGGRSRRTWGLSCCDCGWWCLSQPNSSWIHKHVINPIISPTFKSCCQGWSHRCGRWRVNASDGMWLPVDGGLQH